MLVDIMTKTQDTSFKPLLEQIDQQRKLSKMIVKIDQLDQQIETVAAQLNMIEYSDSQYPFLAKKLADFNDQKAKLLTEANNCCDGSQLNQELQTLSWTINQSLQTSLAPYKVIFDGQKDNNLAAFRQRWLAWGALIQSVAGGNITKTQVESFKSASEVIIDQQNGWDVNFWNKTLKGIMSDVNTIAVSLIQAQDTLDKAMLVEDRQKKKELNKVRAQIDHTLLLKLFEQWQNSVWLQLVDFDHDQVGELNHFTTNSGREYKIAKEQHKWRLRKKQDQLAPSQTKSDDSMIKVDGEIFAWYTNTALGFAYLEAKSFLNGSDDAVLTNIIANINANAKHFQWYLRMRMQQRNTTFPTLLDTSNLGNLTTANIKNDSTYMKLIQIYLADYLKTVEVVPYDAMIEPDAVQMQTETVSPTEVQIDVANKATDAALTQISADASLTDQQKKQLAILQQWQRRWMNMDLMGVYLLEYQNFWQVDGGPRALAYQVDTLTAVFKQTLLNRIKDGSGPYADLTLLPTIWADSNGTVFDIFVWVSGWYQWTTKSGAVFAAKWYAGIGIKKAGVGWAVSASFDVAGKRAWWRDLHVWWSIWWWIGWNWDGIDTWPYLSAELRLGQERLEQMNQKIEKFAWVFGAFITSLNNSPAGMFDNDKDSTPLFKQALKAFNKTQAWRAQDFALNDKNVDTVYFMTRLMCQYAQSKDTKNDDITKQLQYLVADSNKTATEALKKIIAVMYSKDQQLDLHGIKRDGVWFDPVRFFAGIPVLTQLKALLGVVGLKRYVVWVQDNGKTAASKEHTIGSLSASPTFAQAHAARTEAGITYQKLITWLATMSAQEKQQYKITVDNKWVMSIPAHAMIGVGGIEPEEINGKKVYQIPLDKVLKLTMSMGRAQLEVIDPNKDIKEEKISITSQVTDQPQVSSLLESNPNIPQTNVAVVCFAKEKTPAEMERNITESLKSITKIFTPQEAINYYQNPYKKSKNSKESSIRWWKDVISQLGITNDIKPCTDEEIKKLCCDEAYIKANYESMLPKLHLWMMCHYNPNWWAFDINRVQPAHEIYNKIIKNQTSLLGQFIEPWQHNYTDAKWSVIVKSGELRVTNRKKSRWVWENWVENQDLNRFKNLPFGKYIWSLSKNLAYQASQEWFQWYADTQDLNIPAVGVTLHYGSKMQQPQRTSLDYNRLAAKSNPDNKTFEWTFICTKLVDNDEISEAKKALEIKKTTLKDAYHTYYNNLLNATTYKVTVNGKDQTLTQLWFTLNLSNFDITKWDMYDTTAITIPLLKDGKDTWNSITIDRSKSAFYGTLNQQCKWNQSLHFVPHREATLSIQETKKSSTQNMWSASYRVMQWFNDIINLTKGKQMWLWYAEQTYNHQPKSQTWENKDSGTQGTGSQTWENKDKGVVNNWSTGSIKAGSDSAFVEKPSGDPFNGTDFNDGYSGTLFQQNFQPVVVSQVDINWSQGVRNLRNRVPNKKGIEVGHTTSDTPPPNIEQSNTLTLISEQTLANQLKSKDPKLVEKLQRSKENVLRWTNPDFYQFLRAEVSKSSELKKLDAIMVNSLWDLHLEQLELVGGESRITDVDDAHQNGSLLTDIARALTSVRLSYDFKDQNRPYLKQYLDTLVWYLMNPDSTITQNAPESTMILNETQGESFTKRPWVNIDWKFIKPWTKLDDPTKAIIQAFDPAQTIIDSDQPNDTGIGSFGKHKILTTSRDSSGVLHVYEYKGQEAQHIAWSTHLVSEKTSFQDWIAPESTLKSYLINSKRYIRKEILPNYVWFSLKETSTLGNSTIQMSRIDWSIKELARFNASIILLSPYSSKDDIATKLKDPFIYKALIDVADRYAERINEVHRLITIKKS
jgi:hypothetical protein